MARIKSNSGMPMPNMCYLYLPFKWTWWLNFVRKAL
jgi:hypothetical protein